MKVTKFKEEINQMTPEQLQEKLEQLKRDSFSLRLNALTTHVKDYSQFSKLRKDIARVLTTLRQKQTTTKQVK
jgi:large subunit ribosomal protein L29